MKKAVTLRYPLKILLLSAAAACMLDPVATRISGFIPALSPFVSITSAIGSRTLTWFFMLCLPVLFLTILRKRWFCNYACPAGLLLELAGKVRVKKARYGLSPFRTTGKWLVFLGLGGALFGYPLFIWLDPLALLTSFFSGTDTTMTVARFIQMAGLPTLLLLSTWKPNLWCGSICPLGATQEILNGIAAPGSNVFPDADKKQNLILNRRTFMGLAAGSICGGLIAKMTGRRNVIRPPGAIDEARFTGTCSRCGTCAKVCPAGIIKPDLGESGLTGFMTPTISFSHTYCSESCNRCGEVCPTNAIRHNSLPEKQNISIGTAEVIKEKCVCWGKRQHCMSCSDYCPYGAVKTVILGSVACPEIDEAKCRGCGACELVCPAETLAIIVRGRKQRYLEPTQVIPVNDLIRTVI